MARTSEISPVCLVHLVGPVCQEFNKSGVGKLRYRLKGTAFVESPGSFKPPFNEKGEIDLAGPASRETS